VLQENFILIGLHVGPNGRNTIEVAIPQSSTREDGMRVFRYDRDAPTLMIEVSDDVVRDLMDRQKKVRDDARVANSRQVVFKLEIDEGSIESQFKKESE